MASDTPLKLGKRSDTSIVTEGENCDKGLKGDYGAVAFLLLLYVLQSVPAGIAGSMALLLQARNVGYRSQALYSVVSWPFSLKLLWAPVVDAAYSRRFGRRKSWLVPVQYIMGTFMLVLSRHVDWLMGDGDGHDVHVAVLTVVFLSLYFLSATQDIAVDGWGLTILSRRNIGWASTCNAVGPAIGYNLGNCVFLALESPEFCNRYLRYTPSAQGLVTVEGFLYFWGVVFMISTTLILVFKKEEATAASATEADCTVAANVVQTYRKLYSVMKLPSVRSLAVIYLTASMGFTAVDYVSRLKLVERGLAKENLALLTVPMIPVQILLPLIISKYTTGPQPMDLFLKAFPYRLMLNFVFMWLIWWTSYLLTPGGELPNYYYVVLLAIFALQQIGLYTMSIARTSLNARISDPRIGGSYMSLLTTFSNMGNSWPSTLALYAVDGLTARQCLGAHAQTISCQSREQRRLCVQDGGVCATTFEGYYVECALCVLVGLLWLRSRSRTIRQLQLLPLTAWTNISAPS